MKRINRKRLNNKGFTLVELLAVVVILAIVMGIAATSVLSSINNSRKSSLYSTAQNAANTLNTWISEDMIVTDATKKKLGDAFVNQTQQNNTWICLQDLVIQNADGQAKATKKLTAALSLNSTDLIFGSKTPEVEDGVTKVPSVNKDENDSTCSALRYNFSTGGYEILLVARSGGKYYVSADNYGSNNYAFSRAQSAGQPLSD